MIDEPAYTSTRTDPDAYADHALSVIPGIGRIDAQRRGYIRDELAEAFKAGEHQGVCRAIIILAIAQAHAESAETRAVLAACSRLLVGEPT